MISVRKADESQSIFLSGPHDKLAEAVDELIRLQEELAETIDEIYQWVAAYDNGQNAIEWPKLE